MSDHAINIKRSDRRKRAFHAIMSGITCNKGERMRFLTLTSRLPNQDLYRDFSALVKRIRRAYGKFEYFAAWTSEGNGVIHILFFGSYMERDTISGWWSELHGGSWDVDIRSTIHEIDHEGQLKLAGYCLAQYVGNQDKLIRTSYSKNWVYPGFKSDWKALCKYYNYNMDEVIPKWHELIVNDSLRSIVKSRQKTLSGEIKGIGVNLNGYTAPMNTVRVCSLFPCRVDLRGKTK